MAKKKETKKEDKEETSIKSSYDYMPDLIELEPKNYVRSGFLYYITHKKLEIKSKKDLEKIFKDYMKKD